MTIVTEPYILLERTKTRGYRVAYMSPSGAKVIRHRGITESEDAWRQAARLADLHSCAIKVAQ